MLKLIDRKIITVLLYKNCLSIPIDNFDSKSTLKPGIHWIQIIGHISELLSLFPIKYTLWPRGTFMNKKTCVKRPLSK